MSVAQNIKSIRQHIPTQVKLVCVSKFHSFDTIMEAYQEGERIFGESKVQELTDKCEHLPNDIHWHFIGHLQRNKVKFLVPFVELIHGVDSLKLLIEINKQAEKVNRKVNCLLQVHIAVEDTKFGFSPEELKDLFASGMLNSLEHINIHGLMGMATFTENKEQIRNEFRSLKVLFETIKNQYAVNNPLFTEISMGMSDDYQLAIEEGSTMVRIGSSIFGEREY